uniref:SBF1/SBF2 domain-containing protein n=1 Tax=Timema shepardi TaxID=629360 RepID=A0A7R9ALX1_TIMSH|nr:unnamed protein product [Timema shepardi]
MNMCFTFYHEVIDLEVDVPGCEPYKEYLYTYLRDQKIWRSLRFWNAAFFDALQCERVHRPVVTREDIKNNSLEAITDEKQYQENITFGQLGTFTCNMHAFGLSKELCAEFLRKQCIIANLSEEQEKMLRDNIERMYRETDRWSKIAHVNATHSTRLEMLSCDNYNTWKMQAEALVEQAIPTPMPTPTSDGPTPGPLIQPPVVADRSLPEFPALELSMDSTLEALRQAPSMVAPAHTSVRPAAASPRVFPPENSRQTHRPRPSQ